AVYRALRDVGLQEEDARALTAQITWSIYEKLSMPSWRLTRLFAKQPLKRVKLVMDWLMRFPYAPPGYDMRYVATDENVVAIDVYRCPAAEYFGALELSELCVSSWCNLDYPLAEKWGVILERSQTLATGAPYCDFRFRRNDEKKAI
ncbi:MAG: L-2-amino-thiazoline-4-carboxylic acid hydrolase, partial [Chloroflexi bacterium]|nr:L-2-amino-thiazoline-4-carboxylic acid hydrolase [Chloroflexota bacterium]